jgi:hypothetical protein
MKLYKPQKARTRSTYGLIEYSATCFDILISANRKSYQPKFDLPRTNIWKIKARRISIRRAGRIDSGESFSVGFSLAEVSEAAHFVAREDELAEMYSTRYSAVMAAVKQIFSMV